MAWLAFRVKGRSRTANLGAVNRGYEGIGRIIDEAAAYLVYLLLVVGTDRRIWRTFVEYSPG
jgi:hypothetical protein